MYAHRMKRLQIYIESEMDEALALEAVREHVSKAAIIRQLIAEHTGKGVQRDPVDELVGAFEGATGNIDDVVYGR